MQEQEIGNIIATIILTSIFGFVYFWLQMSVLGVLLIIIEKVWRKVFNKSRYDRLF